MPGEVEIKTEQMESSVFQRHHGYHSDFEGPSGQCPQCGVPIYSAPEIHDAHPVQMEYASESGEFFCEACTFDSYDKSGYEIVQPTTETLYVVWVGDQMNRNTYFFETWQAASGFANRTSEAEYKGGREIEPAKLKPVEEHS